MEGVNQKKGTTMMYFAVVIGLIVLKNIWDGAIADTMVETW